MHSDGSARMSPNTFITQPYVPPVEYDLRFQSTLGNAQSGAGLEFDGTDDYIQLESKYNNMHKGDGSISFWINPDTVNDQEIIVNTMGSSSSNPGIDIVNKGSHTGLRVNFIDSGSSWFTNVNTPDSLTVGQWQHVIVTTKLGDSGDLTVKVYIDGVLKEEETFTPSTNDAGGNMAIGRHATDSGSYNYFDGKLDEFTIWDYELDYFAVETLWNQGNGRDPSPLHAFIQNNIKPVTYYNLDDGGATNQYPPAQTAPNVCEDITGENCSAVQVFTFDTASASNTFDLGAQCTYCQDSALSSDGSKLYVFGAPSIWNNAAVFEYDLATPYDVTTGSYVHEFDATAEISIPQFVEFSSDGTKMFYGGSNQGII